MNSTSTSVFSFFFFVLFLHPVHPVQTLCPFTSTIWLPHIVISVSHQCRICTELILCSQYIYYIYIYVRIYIFICVCFQGFLWPVQNQFECVQRKVTTKGGRKWKVMQKSSNSKKIKVNRWVLYQLVREIKAHFHTLNNTKCSKHSQSLVPHVSRLTKDDT